MNTTVLFCLFCSSTHLICTSQASGPTVCCPFVLGSVRNDGCFSADMNGSEAFDSVLSGVENPAGCFVCSRLFSGASTPAKYSTNRRYTLHGPRKDLCHAPLDHRSVNSQVVFGHV